MNFDITVVGNIGIDTNVYLLGEDIDWQNESNFTTNIDYIGQAGGYASRISAQLGYKTAFIGYVGNDFQGRFIKEQLAKDGVDISGIFYDPAGTSRSINIVYPDGRRKNFYDGKSHMALHPKQEICKRIIEKSHLVHFNIPNWARDLLPLSLRLKKIISTDLQDMRDLDDPYRQDFIKAANVIFFSGVNFSCPQESVEHLGRLFSDKIIIAGLGKNGAILCMKGECIHQPAVDDQIAVVDTNGAGDALAMGFLTNMYLKKKDAQTSLREAQNLAKKICSIKGSSDFIRSQYHTQ